MQPPTSTKRPFITRLFISPGEKRLRTGLRIILQTVLLLFLLFVFSIVLIPLLAAFPNDIFLVSQFASLLAITLSVFIARRWLDKRPFKSLGLDAKQNVIKDFLAGTGISAFILFLVFATEWSLGWLQVEKFAWEIHTPQEILVNLFKFVILFLIVAWSEELLARGYWLQNIKEATNAYWGLFFSSVFFAIGHASNPNASVQAVVALILAGLFLGFGTVRTGQLWLSLGLHFGWNFFEGTVFGFPVSGIDFFGIIQQSSKGDVLWTGGAFGPEAGLIIIPTLIIGCLLIEFYVRKWRKM